MSQQVVAAIDAGTNTFRLLIADSPAAVLKPLCKEQEITRLGQGFEPRARLLNELAMDRSLAVMKRFATFLAAYQPAKIRAVATSVVREAENGGEFLARVRRQTGIPLEIITGQQEAVLTAFGVQHGLALGEQPFFLFDIGGGSTEFVYFDVEQQIRFCQSYPLGVVKLTEKYLIGDPPADDAARKLLIEVDSYIDIMLNSLRHLELYPFPEATMLVGSAGTMTTFAAIDQKLVQYDARLINGYELKREQLAVLQEYLWGLPRSKRELVPGLAPGRIDVILAGGLVALRIMKRCGFSRVKVSDCALLEGLAFSLYKKTETLPV